MTLTADDRQHLAEVHHLRQRSNGRGFSASPIDLGDSKVKEKYKRREQGKADEAWRYYNEIGEIWFAHQFVANCLSRMRIFAARRTDPDQPPEALAEDHEASVAVARLSNGDGVSSILHDLGIDLGVCGEGVLVGRKTIEDGETWAMYSPDQVFVNNGDEWAIKDDPKDREGTPLGDEAVAIRIWRNHPRWRKLADSPMFAILDLADELQILSRAVRAAGRSRLAGSGIVLFPQEASVVSVMNPTPGTTATGVDPVIQAIINAAMTAIQDEGAAAAAVPLWISMPKQFIEFVKHMTFDRPLDPIQVEQRKELLHRIASGLDIPSEVVSGIGDLTHWNAWAVDEQVFKSHIEPLMLMICSALTSGFLKLLVPNLDPSIVVWYDPSALLVHPNRAQDAKDLYDRFAISADALRRHSGMPDTDAPSEEELQLRVALNRAGALDPALLAIIMQIAGIIPPGTEIPSSDMPAIPATGEETPPADDTAEPGPPSTEPASSRTNDSFASRVRGERLSRIDRTLRLRLGEKADAATFRLLERVGAQMRRRGGKRFAELTDVPNHLLAAKAGPDAMFDVAVNTVEMTDQAIDGLRPFWDEWVTSAQSTVRSYVSQWAADGEFDEDAAIAQQDEDRSQGWTVFAALLATVMAERIYHPVIDLPPIGESSSSLVPVSVVRQALSVAGGATGERLAGGAVRLADGEIAGGVATGPTAIDLFEAVGLRTRGYVWEYGDSARPFMPHMDLDGVSFTSFDDDVLVNTGDWPVTTHYFPGDHEGCGCGFAVDFEEA